ncbi:hypothetical protein E2C01_026119 [Portunus trituberculatus]|uniref:Uncharacterized protein n=1 Tax=Portunus trituberculatus TaxID=210409 RepID=A0A5B7EEN0_PORTR|nr:hypothetical protein [Portunus trituberculatus]
MWCNGDPLYWNPLRDPRFPVNDLCWALLLTACPGHAGVVPCDPGEATGARHGGWGRPQGGHVGSASPWGRLGVGGGLSNPEGHAGGRGGVKTPWKVW